MCLYPRFFRNPKYKPNKKNGYRKPELPTYIDYETGAIEKDKRVLKVPVGCGNCIECRKQKARAWQIRLCEELKTNPNAYFVTLTFSCESLENICTTYQMKESNAVAGKAIRLFLERYRKKYGKSCRHWLITELGHEGTERIHLHGILWDIKREELEKIWKYGYVWIGDYVNGRTINYIMKYVTKLDHDHKGYMPQIFATAGIGKSFITDRRKQAHRYKPLQTKDYYTLDNGHQLNMPIYYRNQLYSEEEREMLWREKLDKKEIYIRGIRLPIATEEERQIAEQVRIKQQEENEALGYGDLGDEWKRQDYNVTLRMLNADRAPKAQPLVNSGQSED